MSSPATYPLEAHGLIGNGHPLIAGSDLEDGQPGLGEGVEVAARVAVVEIFVVPPEQLHSKHGKHGDDQEQEGEQAEHGAPGGEEHEDDGAPAPLVPTKSLDVPGTDRHTLSGGLAGSQRGQRQVSEG